MEDTLKNGSNSTKADENFNDTPKECKSPDNAINQVDDSESIDRESKTSENHSSKIDAYVSFSLILLIHENSKKKNFKELNYLQKKSIYNSKSMPKISIGDYINRMYRFLHIEDITFICGLIYLDRMCSKTKIMLTQKNVYRLFFTSVLTAIKFLEDKYYTNKYYAKISGVKLTELNQLEAKFIQDIDFQLYIDKNLFNKYYDLYLDQDSLSNKE